MSRSPHVARAIGRILAVAVVTAVILRIALWFIEFGMRLGGG